MKSNYFNSPVIIPTVAASGQHAIFADGDIVFDWVSFDVPRGTARVLGATILTRYSRTLNHAGCLDLIFAKDNGTNTTPGTIGPANAIFGTSTFKFTSNYSDVIGFLPGELSNISGGGTAVTACTIQTSHASPAPIILEPNSTSGANIGVDRYYVAGLASGALNMTGEVTVDGNQTAAETHLDVTTVNATTVFGVGDVVHDESDNLMGKITSLAGNTLTFTPLDRASDGVDGRTVYNVNPYRIIMHLSK